MRGFFSTIILIILAGVFIPVETHYAREKPVAIKNPRIIKDTSQLIYRLIAKEPGLFKNIIDSVNQFEVQVIYTQIDRDVNQNPTFREYSYRLDDRSYFYPASLVKLPVMLMSLEKINKLAIPGFDKYTRLQIDSGYYCQNRVVTDKSLDNSVPSIAHYCKKMMLVSDNDGYNHLYEFLGQKYLNERLWQMGYSKALIIQRFNGCTYECNKYTNPMKFYNSNNEVVYSQPMAINPNNYKNPLGEVRKGKAYLNGGRILVEQPMDFTFSNTLPLQELHDMFVSLIFPEAVLNEKKFNLTEDDFKFMMKYMAMYPRESEFDTYRKSNWFPDNLKKYFLWGSTMKHITDIGVKSINIVGQSDGYLADCAYIVDFKNNTEFILLAVIYTNQSGVFNYTNYRYSSIGFPFLENLGKTFYNYELKRTRKYKPNLTKLQKLLIGN